MKKKVTWTRIGDVLWPAVLLYFLVKAGQEDGWWTIPVYLAGGVVLMYVLVRAMDWWVDRNYRSKS